MMIMRNLRCGIGGGDECRVIAEQAGGAAGASQDFAATGETSAQAWVHAPEALICAVLRGEAPAWPEGAPADLAERVIEGSRAHGVHALVHQHAGALPGWPLAVVDALRRDAIREAASEILRQQVAAEVLEALAEAGIGAVVFKGTALAYSLFPDPALRARCDTDVLVPEESRRQAIEVLAGIGFRRVLTMGEFASYQACLTREEVGGHTIDLHWRINNSELLARIFSYPELRTGAVPLPGLSPRALGAKPVHGLLIACMHRAKSLPHPPSGFGPDFLGAERLIWLYDMHLLAGQLGPGAWDELVVLSSRKGFRAVCLEALRQTRACFGTGIPDAVLEQLAIPGPQELSAVYARAGRMRRRWLDLLAYGGLRDKLRFAGEFAFPPAEYMRERFPNAKPDWLAWRYVLRAWAGLRRGGSRG